MVGAGKLIWSVNYHYNLYVFLFIQLHIFLFITIYFNIMKYKTTFRAFVNSKQNFQETHHLFFIFFPSICQAKVIDSRNIFPDVYYFFLSYKITLGYLRLVVGSKTNISQRYFMLVSLRFSYNLWLIAEKLCFRNIGTYYANRTLRIFSVS